MLKRKKDRERPAVTGYDYSDREHREQTIQALFGKAQSARRATERDWERYNDYYNFIHDITGETQEAYADAEMPFAPSVMPDAFIHVESQICATVPEPEFRGRDDGMDPQKAKEREYAARFVCDNNRLKDKNTANERRLIKLGDAFWKVFWDPTMVTGVNEGDIRVDDVPVESIYPDPAARERGLQAGQYVFHLYRMHKVAFVQQYGKAIEEVGTEPEHILSNDYAQDLDLFDLSTSINEDDDTVTVLEHWFKQPKETEENGVRVPAGAVACSIIVGGHEVKYIPNYWENTCRQNHLFPFVHYWRIRDENQFYNKSELFAIMDLIDMGDRKLAMAQLNDAMMSNDVIVREENALADGSELDNRPGGEIVVRDGRLSGVQRLGGLQPLRNAADSVAWITEQIQRTNRNFDSSQGRETTRQTTATALAMLRSDAEEQANIKTADRTAGFERLYELIDWSVQEFYDTTRHIYIGSKKKGEPDVSFDYLSGNYTETMPAIVDSVSGQIVREEYDYWPRVDVIVSAGDGIVHSKQATLKALEGLAAMNVTAQNYKVLAAELEVLDIPQKQEIIDGWRQQFETPQQEATEGGLTQAQTGGLVPESYLSPQDEGGVMM